MRFLNGARQRHQGRQRPRGGGTTSAGRDGRRTRPSSTCARRRRLHPACAAVRALRDRARGAAGHAEDQQRVRLVAAQRVERRSVAGQQLASASGPGLGEDRNTGNAQCLEVSIDRPHGDLELVGEAPRRSFGRAPAGAAGGPAGGRLALAERYRESLTTDVSNRPYGAIMSRHDTAGTRVLPGASADDRHRRRSPRVGTGWSAVRAGLASLRQCEAC